MNRNTLSKNTQKRLQTTPFLALNNCLIFLLLLKILIYLFSILLSEQTGIPAASLV